MSVVFNDLTQNQKGTILSLCQTVYFANFLTLFKTFGAERQRSLKDPITNF